eukprot:3801657-Amphidinium_carterae.2
MAAQPMPTTQRRQKLIRKKLETSLQGYNQPIISCGEKVYIEKQTAPNMRLYQRNQLQNHEAIWIARDTATGQRITLTPVFGKLRSRTVMRLPKEQQLDKDLLLRVTSLTDARTTKRIDKATELIPQPLLELQSPTQPALRHRPGTIVQDLHNKPPDQWTIDQPPRQQKFPEWPHWPPQVGPQQQRKSTPEPQLQLPLGNYNCHWD